MDVLPFMQRVSPGEGGAVKRTSFRNLSLRRARAIVQGPPMATRMSPGEVRMQVEAQGAAPAAETETKAAGATAPRALAEPATSRALWPTFMRRTLAEDVLESRAVPSN
jgi:hypothetical protein